MALADSSPALDDRPASAARRLLASIRRDYFRNTLDSAISIACIALVAYLVVRAAQWGILNSVWTAKDGEECAKQGSGACWAVIRARIQLMLFGLYPHAEIWRAGLGCIVLLSACTPHACRSSGVSVGCCRYG